MESANFGEVAPRDPPPVPVLSRAFVLTTITKNTNSARENVEMLTRRDTLLVRPWQQRQFNRHRIKVLSALPAVDVAPPQQRLHVAINLKQVQREKERCEKIDQDNLRLVQRLAGVMRTSRVDNRWERPQPLLLERVGIYHSNRVQSAPCRLCPHLESRWQTDDKMSDGSEVSVVTDLPRNRTCLACHPEIARRKLRELSLRQSKIHERKPVSPEIKQDVRALEIADQRSSKPLTQEQSKRRRLFRRGKSAPPPGPFHQLVVSYDALRLAVNFPAHASVLLASGRKLQYESARLPTIL